MSAQSAKNGDIIRITLGASKKHRAYIGQMGTAREMGMVIIFDNQNGESIPVLKHEYEIVRGADIEQAEPSNAQKEGGE